MHFDSEKVKGNGKEKRKGKKKRKKKGNGKGKGKERWKKDSLKNVGRMNACTDAQVILYSDQCYALHWTDKNK